jgi:hypothetical protein
LSYSGYVPIKPRLDAFRIHLFLALVALCPLTALTQNSNTEQVLEKTDKYLSARTAQNNFRGAAPIFLKLQVHSLAKNPRKIPVALVKRLR